MGFCCDRSYESAYKMKFVALGLPVPEIIWGRLLKNMGLLLDMLTLPFLQNFHGLLLRSSESDGSCECTSQI